MHMFAIIPLLSMLSPLFLSWHCGAAPSDVTKAELSDGTGPTGQFDDVSSENADSNFVRIGRGSRFFRIGRPGNFVRIGRSYGGQVDQPTSYEAEDDSYSPAKRASRFVRIGKGSRFVRIGKSHHMEPSMKRKSSFVRIGKADPYSDLDSGDLQKRFSSFVRIGRYPSSGFVRIGRSANSEKEGDMNTLESLTHRR